MNPNGDPDPDLLDPADVDDAPLEQVVQLMLGRREKATPDLNDPGFQEIADEMIPHAAPPDPGERLYQAVCAYMKANGATFDQALAAIKQTDPDLYAEATAPRARRSETVKVSLLTTHGTSPRTHAVRADRAALDQVFLEAEAIAKTEGLAFGLALERVRRAKPDLFTRATAHYGRR